MYVYLDSQPGVWTVGYYKPDGTFDSESDHASSDEAAQRVAWLNGGPVVPPSPGLNRAPLPKHEWLNMDTHFLELVRKGRLPGASSGEVKALVLACAVVDEVPGLDSRAIRGLCDFVWFVSTEPQTAKEILRGLRSEDS